MQHVFTIAHSTTLWSRRSNLIMSVVACCNIAVRNLDAGWVNRTATASGIPAVAVRAYATAAVRLADKQPDCRLGWSIC